MSGFLSLEDVLACKVTECFWPCPPVCLPFYSSSCTMLTGTMILKGLGHGAVTTGPVGCPLSPWSATSQRQLRSSSGWKVTKCTTGRHHTRDAELNAQSRRVLEIIVTPNHAFLSINVTWQVLVLGFCFGFFFDCAVACGLFPDHGAKPPGSEAGWRQ